MYNGKRADDLINLLFIENIQIDYGVFKIINDLARKKCEHPNGNDETYYCKLIRDYATSCNRRPWDIGNVEEYVYFEPVPRPRGPKDSGEEQPPEVEAIAAKNVFIKNGLRTECDYKGFYSGWVKLNLAASQRA